ncbi:alpha/beta fold hydrolase [Aquihabitans sp. McL0605]|uniref:alpha/beta fold hydrolase n=1 Tax=Aquihabitans sp. McL0605 TaxID=3415671 RepID=UPI003CEBE281
MAAAPTPPVVLLHGFTQTGASWRPVADLLRSWRLDPATPDLPGHGTAGDLRLDLAGSAARIADLIGGEPAIVVGYSMGGRTALRLALDHPGSVRSLVLIGATAGITEPGARTARRAADEVLAQRIEREGVEPFLEEWLAQPLFADLEVQPDDLAARRANTPEGLASSLRLTGTGTMDPPWWDELAAIDAPTVVTWGARDAKFAALGQRLVDAIGPNASGMAVPHSGHAAHLEVPAAFAELVVTRFVR